MSILINPKLKGEFLVHKNNGIIPIKIPFGCITNKNVINNYIYNYDSENNRLTATCRDNPNEIIEILPVYSAIDNINFMNRNISIRVHVVFSKLEQWMANTIIENTHYLKPPNKGLTIIAEFVNSEDKVFVLENINTENLDFINNIFTQSSNALGCAIIDRLTYANPRGRVAIAREMGLEEQLPSNRAEQLNLLEVAWISRFAVLNTYQGLGVGQVLARHIAIVASSRIIPQAKYVEVFTSHPKDVAKGILETESKGFLKKAGYNIYNELLNSKQNIDPEDESKFITYKKLYYYKRVTE